jgi:hypothetical protein
MTSVPFLRLYLVLVTIQKNAAEDYSQVDNSNIHSERSVTGITRDYMLQKNFCSLLILKYLIPRCCQNVDLWVKTQSDIDLLVIVFII